MARASRQRANDAPPAAPANAGAACYLFLFRDGATAAGVQFLRDTTRLPFPETAADGLLPPGDMERKGLVLSQLGVAVALLTPEQLVPFDDLPANAPIELLRQEGTMAALTTPAPFLPFPRPDRETVNWSADYVRGYRDATVQFLDHAVPVLPNATMAGPVTPDYLLGYRAGIVHVTGLFGAPPAAGVPPAPRAVPLPTKVRTAGDASWALEATGVLTSPYSGAGVKVALLDSGLDRNHPDFKDDERVQACVSFLPGEDASDINGHGTCCAGVLCGPKTPQKGPRYGIAHAAELYAGKVLGPTGKGPDWVVLAGINWALAQGCRVICLPFGMAPRGPRPEAFYAAIGRRALAQNAVVVAAGGGHSNRALGKVAPVAVPANGDTMLGVGAVDEDLKIANFSNGTRLKTPGSIDVVAPGVNVRSANQTACGTSLAAACVAGIAALIAQSLGDANGPAAASAIIRELLLSARPLHEMATDVGKGLVYAPQ